MTINRSNIPSLTRKRGGRTSSVRDPHKLAGSSTHQSIHDEPSFVKLHASHADTTDGLPHEYNPKMRSSRSKRIMTGGRSNKYWPDPLEFGPNYQHNLAKDHWASGGYADGGHLVDALHDVLHAAAGMWIQHAIQNPGSLHKALKVPKGQKIPMMKLEKATHSQSPLMRKRANLALTLKGFHNKG